MVGSIQTADTSRPHEEEWIAPGVSVRRRSVFMFCGATLGLQALQAAGAASAQHGGEFEDFLRVANETAERLVGDVSAVGQDRYLRALAAEAALLGDAPSPSAWRDSGQSDGPGTYIGANPGGVRFTILHWRMDPGTRILPHAHTYGNVVTIGLEGAVRVRNYEMIGSRDYLTDAEFVVQNTIDQWLSPGDANLVSLERNYIHGFDAGESGARGLDITTRIAPRPDFGVPYLESLQPRGAPEARLFSAHWRHG